MIECIFTLDYEIYGNGTGSLKELVYEPAEQLKQLFLKWNARLVTFIEVAELERIEECGTDSAIDLVKGQILDLWRDGFEIALHLHPQWYNATHEQGRWLLDSAEYNLCTLPLPRIVEIVNRSLNYMRHLVAQSSFTPLSFRAGNWLFQPTHPAASVMAEKGIKIDSSVFKGGTQRANGLDYRPALRNGYYWRFERDAIRPDPTGPWIELPIYTKMVPFWRMATSKRLSFSNSTGVAGRSAKKTWSRGFDLLRFLYPLKLDFCRMTLRELTSVMDDIIREDQDDSQVIRPVVAIGHTKDLTDIDTVDSFLAYLKTKGIAVGTFTSIYPKVARQLELV